MRRRYRGSPAAISDLLGRATRRFAEGNDSVLSRVRAVWPEVSGPGTVNHAYPIRRSRAGVVTVACTDAVWAQELDMQAEHIMSRLGNALGDPTAVAGLRFVVADHAIPVPDPGPSEVQQLPPPSAQATAQGQRAAEGIEDPVLRDLVARAAARSADRAKG